MILVVVLIMPGAPAAPTNKMGKFFSCVSPRSALVLAPDAV